MTDEGRLLLLHLTRTIKNKARLSQGDPHKSTHSPRIPASSPGSPALLACAPGQDQLWAAAHTCHSLKPPVGLGQKIATRTPGVESPRDLLGTLLVWQPHYTQPTTDCPCNGLLQWSWPAPSLQYRDLPRWPP